MKIKLHFDNNKKVCKNTFLSLTAKKYRVKKIESLDVDITFRLNIICRFIRNIIQGTCIVENMIFKTWFYFNVKS